MTRVWHLALLSIVLAGAARADPRIMGRAYHSSEVVELRGGPGIESTIAFADDERIENVAVGDSAAWQVTPNKRANLLFVKPASLRARTNMTVVTNQRTYLFDLVSGASRSAVYMLRFNYPDAPKSAPKLEAGAPVAVAAVVPPPAPPRLVQHFAWVAKGQKRLIPTSFYDDGSSTFLRWNREETIPAILARAANGSEGPIDYTVKGEYIVLDGVPSLLVLRSGRDVATLAPDPRRLVIRQEMASGEPRKLTAQDSRP